MTSDDTSHKMQANPNSCCRILLGVLLALGNPSLEAHAMGKRIEKIITGDSGGEFWEDVKEARPRIKQIADAYLKERGHDIATWASEVYVKGGGSGDEVWTAVYWKVAPENPLAQHGDLEVYLNNQGKVRRVVKYEQGKVQLLYGKDERIEKGMTPDQVREHLGEPDYKGIPPKWARQHGDTEFWKYNKNSDRTMTIEISFKEGKVSFVSRSGE